MPFGGLVVNRVHPAPGLDGELPPSSPKELGAELAERVGASARELAALAERDAAGVEHLRDGARRPADDRRSRSSTTTSTTSTASPLVREHLFAA